MAKMYGSVVNRLMENKHFHLPKVGEDVTECLWSDREAYHCVEVSKDGRTATLIRYKPKFVGSGYGDERYEFVDDNGNLLLSSMTIKVRFKYNKWRVLYEDGKTGGIKNLAWGVRSEYRDPSF